MKKSFPVKCLTMLVLLALCCGAVDAQRRRAAAASSGPPARLTAMRIIPYNEMSDTFADEVTDQHNGFFNELDVSFLVKIEVTGKAGEYSDRNVEITIRQGRKVTQTRVSMVGIYNEQGKYYVPYWIYSPICQDTVIQARLLGQRTPSILRKTITAHCGE
ncbi:MAG TPA: hypothetical protein VM095_17675 [Pyrinomonadaceae bacterium]|nr:hypothetical protein [Pyrinomonadaceae bacterium]